MVLTPSPPSRAAGGPVWSRAGLHALAATPAAWLLWAALADRLGADPVATLTHETGEWALRLLLACLAMTPLRRLSGRGEWLRYRRMLGLWAFAYACAHLLVYVVLDLGGYWTELFADIVKRPYITAGALAFALLLPLAATSTRAAMRGLGRNWARLHRAIYLAAPLAVLHFWWLVKADLGRPSVYAGVLTLLLLLRLPRPDCSARSRVLKSGPG